MTVAITQPTYLPWLGYFNLISSADIFVVLDTVQFEKQSWQSRNRIRTNSGEVLWLTVPVAKHPLNTPIREVGIAQNPPSWRKKQSKTIEQQLGRAPFFEEAARAYEAILGDPPQHTLLADLNIAFIQTVARLLGLNTKVVRCSELPVTGNRAELLLDICRHFRASRYYSNAGSAVYLDEFRPLFSAAGVDLVYQQWSHPEYLQMGKLFISHLSCLDAIACMGLENARESIVNQHAS